MLGEAVANLLRYAAPLSLAAIGESIGQKAGVLNIGLEGTMLSASYAGLLADQATGSPWVALVVGVVTGIIVGLVQAWFTLGMAADAVVVGTAVNLLSLGLTSTAFRFRFGSSGQLLHIPTLPQAGGWDAIMVFAILVAGAGAFLLAKTKWGLLVRGAGEYPPAVNAAGFSVWKVRLQAICFASGLAGLGGAYLTVGVVGSFAENMTAGRGFLALAIVTFGRWKPPWVVGAALLVGAADWGQYALQSANLGIPSQLLRALPYLLALSVLMFAGSGTSTPSALGQAYEGEG